MTISNKLFLLVCAFFTFCTFILTIIATAGSTSNYKPINNIYMGEADISRINVTKVIPETGPVLAVLAAALTAPNASYEEIFSAMKAISETSALEPLLTLLGDAESTDETLQALTVLSPLAMEGNSSSTAELRAIQDLLQNSNNSTATIESLGALVLNGSSSNSSSSKTVFSLLEDSKNASATVDSLVVLDSLSLSEKSQLSPVFTLFSESKNRTATLQSLSTLMSANVSSSLASTLFSALASSDNLQSSLSSLASSLPDSQAPLIAAVGTLLQSSENATQTLTVLSGMVRNNVTQSSSAKKSFAALTTLMQNSNNQTLVLTSVQTLALSSDPNSTTQLTALDELLGSSKNATETLAILAELESSAASGSNAEAIPYLFQLIGASTNATETFSSLLELTAFAQANPSTFAPIVKILSSATSSNNTVSEEELLNLMPEVLQYLNIATDYRLGIFTICRTDVHGKVLSCSKSHAVQPFDMRNILYTELENSDFRPYMQALGINKQDLYLEGKLQDRESEYVPAVRAVLSFNLLTTILSFVLLVLLLAAIFTNGKPGTFDGRLLLISRILSILVFLFAILGAAIVAALTHIIKSGSKDDDYGVIYKAGSPYNGLVWTAFVLSLLTMILLWVMRFRKNKDPSVAQEEGIVGSVHSHSTSEGELTEKDRRNSLPEVHQENN